MSANTSFIDIKRIFDSQKDNLSPLAASTPGERAKKLKRLHDTIIARRQDFRDALFADYRKPAPEVDLTETYVVLSELNHAIHHVRRWTRKHRVRTPLALLGTSSYIRYEPKGMTLVIAPWNCPLQLSLCPLVSSVAAGNAVIIKPSEMAPHASSLLKSLLAEVFPENEVAVVEGDAAVAAHLVSLEFNHVFFTGSATVGKAVMKASVEHLASVTLELGGKSPVIVDETANIETAARRIAAGKLYNAGQLCLAPDTVFVHQSREAEFLRAYQRQVERMYGNSDDGLLSGDYTRIVNRHHLLRLKAYLEDAVQKGARIESGGTVMESANLVSPTVLTHVTEDMLVAREEIYGPILLVCAYAALTDVIRHIRAKDRPLALYVFSTSRRNISLILEQTSSGGVTVNDVAMHFYNPHLPFGGVGHSGLGKGRGEWAFREFSNAKGVLTQWLPVPVLEMKYPPFTAAKKKLIDVVLKWL